MATLYELTEELQMLLSMAEDEDIDPEAFQDTLEGLEGEIEIKAEGYAMVMKQIDSDIAGMDGEIKRLQARKKSYEASKERMKKALESAMIATGKTKFKTNLFSFGIQKNPASLVIDNEDQIPPEYLKIKYEANKDAIKEAIKAGEDIGWARLVQTEGLRIR